MDCCCNECIKGCWRSPGWFGSIEEIEGAAKISNMPVKDFVCEYLIREWYYAETIEIPAPRRNFKRYQNNASKCWLEEDFERNGKGFVRASWGHNLMSGFACIFLTKDNRCTIHNSKPQECRETFGCKEVNTTIRQGIEDYWAKHQDWIEQYIPKEE